MGTPSGRGGARPGPGLPGRRPSERATRHRVLCLAPRVPGGRSASPRRVPAPRTQRGLTHGGQRVEVLQPVPGRVWRRFVGAGRGRAVGGLPLALQRRVRVRLGHPGRLHGGAFRSGGPGRAGGRGGPRFPGRSLGGRRGGGISGAPPCAPPASRRAARGSWRGGGGGGDNGEARGGVQCSQSRNRSSWWESPAASGGARGRGGRGAGPERGASRGDGGEAGSRPRAPGSWFIPGGPSPPPAPARELSARRSGGTGRKRPGRGRALSPPRAPGRCPPRGPALEPRGPGVAAGPGDARGRRAALGRCPRSASPPNRAPQRRVRAEFPIRGARARRPRPSPAPPPGKLEAGRDGDAGGVVPTQVKLENKTERGLGSRRAGRAGAGAGGPGEGALSAQLPGLAVGLGRAARY